MLHLVSYRAFQEWLIANFVGIEFLLSPELVAGFDELLPAGADAETRLLCAVGFWHP